MPEILTHTIIIGAKEAADRVSQGQGKWRKAILGHYEKA